MMHKHLTFIVLLLAALLLLSACGPGKEPVQTTGENGQTASPPETDVQTEAPAKTTATVGGCTFLLTDGGACLTSYEGTDKVLEIPAEVEGKPVTEIAEMAFAYCGSLESVTLPGSLKAVPDWCFLGCPALASVTVGEGTEILGKGCFDYCEALVTVRLPSTLQVIGEAAFQGSGLTEIALPDSLTEIGYKAFANTKLNSVVLPASCSKLGDGLFVNCTSLTTAEFRAQITKLPKETFSYCSALKSVVLPETVETLGESAFFRCTSLETFRFPMQLIRVLDSCFYGCTSMRSIVIPGTAFVETSYVGFHFMPVLTDIYYAGTEEQWSRVEIDKFCDALAKATVHYESTGE